MESTDRFGIACVRSTRLTWAYLAVITFACWTTAVAQPPSAVQSLMETARTAGRSGDWAAALPPLLQAQQRLQTEPDAASPDTELTLYQAIATAAWHLKRYDLAATQCETLLRRLPATETQRRTAAQQMLVRSLTEAGQLNRALVELQSLTTVPAAATEFVIDQAMIVGARALASGQHNVSVTAYQMVLNQPPETARHVDARLGLAWAAAAGGLPVAEAEWLLDDFIRQHPSHPDLAQAMAQRLELLQRLDRKADADEVRRQLLSLYPDTAAAQSVLDDVSLAITTPWPAEMQQRWKTRLKTVDSTTMPDAAVTAKIFQVAFESGDDAFWNLTLDALLASDPDGQLTSDVLAHWAGTPNTAGVPNSPAAPAAMPASISTAALAEHLVIDLLGKLIDRSTVAGDVAGNRTANAAAVPTTQSEAGIPDSAGQLPAACAAACRWCGTQGRWPLLAMLTEDLQAPDPSDPATLRRGLAIDRLIAESLMQTRRGTEALAWWTSICAAWQCSDFPTRLRAAEVAVAFGTLDQAAGQLAAARGVAAADDPFQQSLLQMLSAELDMRHQRLSQARQTLATIARQPAAAGELRPRAQWLIGETYLMQEQYSEAIDAYRRVEALDHDGQWTAAAMLQTGQAHEKLGQARQAAACYTALLSRFANLPHASRARTRLAQLDEASSLHR